MLKLNLSSYKNLDLGVRAGFSLQFFCPGEGVKKIFGEKYKQKLI